MSMFDDETNLDRSMVQPVLRGVAVLRFVDARGPQAVTIAGRTLLGTAREASLCVSDPLVSRLHAELVPREDGLWITDLGSTNGTYVNALRVTGARLRSGDVLRVGRLEFSVTFSQDAQAVELYPHERFGPLLGRSPAMRELFAQLARLAPHDVTVLVRGDTGTGKELVARALHEASPRREGPYVVVDCAALPENLLESELFGHTRGAFTGAVAARAGAFECADGGTLFLDEIGELPLSLQPRLLRALEARTVRRLGENAHRPFNARVLAASHRDLRAMVNAGSFREDLYFRLAVVPVEVPPLRARRDDIALLAAHFAARLGATPLTSALLDEAQRAPWPGNVRELRNFVERCSVLGPSQAHALLASLRGAPLDEGAPSVRPAVPNPSAPAALDDAATLRVDLDVPFKELRERWTDTLERAYVRGLLERHRGNISAVAQAAGLDRSYVHRLVRKHEL